MNKREYAQANRTSNESRDELAQSLPSRKRERAKLNKEWLANKAKEEGVKPLPKGIYYKVLAEGRADGKHPTPRSIVTVHYTGSTIDGKQFDSSRGGVPLAIRLRDLIEGWIIAMQQMCIGVWWLGLPTGIVMIG